MPIEKEYRWSYKISKGKDIVHESEPSTWLLIDCLGAAEYSIGVWSKYFKKYPQEGKLTLQILGTLTEDL